MAATLEIKYFNSYILKNTEEGGAINQPRWNGSKGIPQVIGGFAQFTSFYYPTCFAI